MVHFEEDCKTIRFSVYPVIDWKGADGKEGTSYVKKNTGCDMLENFDENEAEENFCGSYCWRGVWEGRIYFKDTEHWAEDILEFSNLLNDKIIPQCKEFLKALYPEHDLTDFKRGND